MKGKFLFTFVALATLVAVACARPATPTPTPTLTPTPTPTPTPSPTPPPTPTPTPTPIPTPTPTPKPTPTPEVVRVEVVLTARYAAFEPSKITVAKGQTIVLKLISRDFPHTFTIDELGINVAVGGGQTVTKEIKVDKTGTYTFYCAVPGHRGAGMGGAFVVNEGGAPETETPVPTTPTPDQGY